MRANTFALSSLIVASAVGCMQSGGTSPSSTDQVGGKAATGGASSTNTSLAIGGGTSGVGGNLATGGVASATGGNLAVGGKSNSGGAPAAGGNVSTGGRAAVGGNVATGGGFVIDVATGGGNVIDVTTGGAGTTGGTKSTGGLSSTGGTKSAGGAINTGGTPPTGGSSAMAASTGGATSVGGGSSSPYYGFQPVPNSQNTTNFNPTTWYTSWKSKFYVDCANGTGQARIANGQGSGNTVSEGIGYGMLLAVGNADKPALDALWAYYKAHVDVNGLMNWSINQCDSGNNNAYAATDADEDVAMALVQADAKWGGYKTDATNLIGLIKKYETAAGTPSYLRPGDAANNGGKGDGTVNPSYFATGYWHVWATYVSDPFWNQLADDAYTMLAKFQALSISDPLNAAYIGALVPDWGTSQGQNPNNNKYWYDACRTPWRVAVDYAWYGNSPAQTFLQNVSAFIDAKGGIATMAPSYGNGGAGNSAFLGPYALSGMAVSQAKADTYLNAWLSANMDDSQYFQGSLRGVFLLLANHNFPKGI